MRLKLVFLMVTRALSLLGLSRREPWWKDAEILMLRHQLAVAERERPGARSRLTWPGSASPWHRPLCGRSSGAPGIDPAPRRDGPGWPEFLEDAGTRVKFVLHDRDASFTVAFDEVLQTAGVVQVAPDTQAALALVGAEVGCHLTLISMARNVADPHVVFVPLDESAPDVDVRAAWRTGDRGSAVRAVLEELFAISSSAAA